MFVVISLPLINASGVNADVWWQIIGANDGGVMDDLAENTDWVTCTITFEDNTWEYVGVRFKGNSSLKSIWSSSSTKFPLKLDFDEFEDAYPTIDDQRF